MEWMRQWGNIVLLSFALLMMNYDDTIAFERTEIFRNEQCTELFYNNRSSIETVQPTQGLWLYGETPVTGISNQLVTFYSFLPFALVLRSGLLLGPAYSRRSFSDSMFIYGNPRDPYSKIKLHISDIIDISLYEALFKKYSVMLDRRTDLIEDCLSKPLSHADVLPSSAGVVEVRWVQRTRWKSSSDEQILSMLNASQISIISLKTSNSTKKTVIRVKSRNKLLGFYNFYHGIITSKLKSRSASMAFIQNIISQSKGIALLKDIHSHIKPSPRLRTIISKILQNLPKTFWAIHIRMESDVIFDGTTINQIHTFNKKKAEEPKYSLDWLPDSAQTIVQSQIYSAISKYMEDGDYTEASKDTLFYNALRLWTVSLFSSSSCVSQYLKRGGFLSADTNIANSSSSPPTNTQMFTDEFSFPHLFISSGLYPTSFNISSVNPISSKNSSNSNTTAIGAHIYRSKIVKSVLKELGFKSIYTKSDLFISAEKHQSFPSDIIFNLYPELDAYIDLEIARRSTCFIPAHIASSFSYFIQRLRELDNGIELSKIGSPHARFKAFFI